MKYISQHCRGVKGCCMIGAFTRYQASYDRAAGAYTSADTTHDACLHDLWLLFELIFKIGIVGVSTKQLGSFALHLHRHIGSPSHTHLLRRAYMTALLDTS
jgi:hypothetical protein